MCELVHVLLSHRALNALTRTDTAVVHTHQGAHVVWVVAELPACPSIFLA